MEPADCKNGAADNYKKHKNNDFIQCEEGPGIVAYLLTLGRLQINTADHKGLNTLAYLCNI